MSQVDWAALAGDGDPDVARRVVALAASGAASPLRQRRVALARLARHGVAAPRDVLADLERAPRPRGAAPASTAPDTDAVGRRLAALGARVLVLGQPGYPARLTPLWPELGPPLWLFARSAGDAGWANGPAVAVVGSRHPSFDGLDIAEELGRLLARAGVTVVSGMARGIDEAAHRGALAAGGRTVAVLGTGLAVDYPRGRTALKDEIAASGAVVTELAPDAPPRGHQFLERNRVVAGLADAVVVVEGRARSGALATARLAAEQGRDVWAVPGSPSQPTARAPLDLIRDGARPLTRLDDVLDGLTEGPTGVATDVLAASAARPRDARAAREGPASGERARDRSAPDGGRAGPGSSGTPNGRPAGGPAGSLAAPAGPASAVAAALTAVPASADALLRATGLPLPTVLAALAELTARGLARTTPRGWVAGGRA